MQVFNNPHPLFHRVEQLVCTICTVNMFCTLSHIHLLQRTWSYRVKYNIS
uniref:Uncharacterized protein n=1 Tax=Anguilla anguilla TaxID=7936 RepID=A0A0E9QZE2_ANGAN